MMFVLLTLRCFVVLLLVVVIGEGGIQRPALPGCLTLMSMSLGAYEGCYMLLNARCRLGRASNMNLNHRRIPASAETG
jgi:hypothetical protein